MSYQWVSNSYHDKYGITCHILFLQYDVNTKKQNESLSLFWLFLFSPNPIAQRYSTLLRHSHKGLDCLECFPPSYLIAKGLQLRDRVVESIVSRCCALAHPATCCAGCLTWDQWRGCFSGGAHMSKLLQRTRPADIRIIACVWKQEDRDLTSSVFSRIFFKLSSQVILK